MPLKKVKRMLAKILRVVKDYELEKLQKDKDIISVTEKIKKLTEDIRNTPTS